MRQAYTKFTKKKQIIQKMRPTSTEFSVLLIKLQQKDSLKMPQNMQIAPAVAFFVFW